MYSEYQNYHDNQLELIMQILVRSNDQVLKKRELTQLKIQENFQNSEHDLKSQDKGSLDQEEVLKSNRDTQESDEVQNTDESRSNF